LFLLRNSRCDQRDNGGKTEAGVPWADDSQNCCFYEQIGARQARGPGAGRGDWQRVVIAPQSSRRLGDNCPSARVDAL